MQAVEGRTRAAVAVATGADNSGGSGRRQLRLWKWLREKGGWEGGWYEFEKAPPPPPFIKPKQGSRRVHFAIIANLSQTCFTCKSNFQY